MASAQYYVIVFYVFKEPVEAFVKNTDSQAPLLEILILKIWEGSEDPYF